MSAISVPVRSRVLRVSSSGMSSTTIKTCFSLVRETPLVQNFVVVSSQTVNALYHKYIASLKPEQQPLIVGAVEVLSGLSVAVDIPVPDAKGPQHNKLAFFILMFGGYARVTIYFS